MLALLTVLGTALVARGAWTEMTEVLVAAGSVVVLPCSTGSSLQTPLTVMWMRSKLRQMEEPLGTRPALSTVWRMDASGMEFRGMGVGQRSRCSHASVAKGDFSLQIESAQDKDGGEYTCVVNGRPVGQVTLRVIQVSVSSPQAEEGSNVTMTCNVIPWPTGVTVTWTLNGRPYLPVNRNILWREGKEQHLVGVSIKEAGRWECVVQYRSGRGYRGHRGSAESMLTVEGISNPAGDEGFVYAELGSSVLLPCVFSTHLTLKKQAWLREGDTPGPAKAFPQSFFSPHLSSHTPRDLSAQIKSVEVGDGGLYVCQGWLENRIVKRQLHLVTAQVLQSSTAGNAPAMLTCHLSNTMGVTRYEWVWVAHNASGVQTVTPFHWEKTLNADKLKVKGAGEYVCRFYGEQGMLGNVTYHPHVTSAQQGDEQSRAPSAGMILGLSVLFLVLLLIVLQMYKNHRRRKMILQYPALETIVHASVNAQERRERSRADAKAQDQSLET